MPTIAISPLRWASGASRVGYSPGGSRASPGLSDLRPAKTKPGPSPSSRRKKRRRPRQRVAGGGPTRPREEPGGTAGGRMLCLPGVTAPTPLWVREQRSVLGYLIFPFVGCRGSITMEPLARLQNIFGSVACIRPVSQQPPVSLGWADPCSHATHRPRARARAGRGLMSRNYRRRLGDNPQRGAADPGWVRADTEENT